MTGPLRLTLEEAMRAVEKRLADGRAEHGAAFDVQMEFTETGWWVLGADGIREFATWPEAASYALGMPVVERNDTAELVEALEAVVGALTSVTVFHHHAINHKAHGTTDALDKAAAVLAKYRRQP